MYPICFHPWILGTIPIIIDWAPKKYSIFNPYRKVVFLCRLSCWYFSVGIRQRKIFLKFFLSIFCISLLVSHWQEILVSRSEYTTGHSTTLITFTASTWYYSCIPWHIYTYNIWILEFSNSSCSFQKKNARVACCFAWIMANFGVYSDVSSPIKAHFYIN